MRFFVYTFLLAMVTTLANAQLVSPGASLQRVDSNFSFTEGPTPDNEGNIYFTDQPNNTIWKYDTQGVLSKFLSPARRANGMYFDGRENLLACADEAGELIAISLRDKKISVLASKLHNSKLNGLNDVWMNRRTGTIYLTDPFYQRDYWTRTKPDPAMSGEHLLFLPPGKQELVIADSTLKKPNGIVGTPDGKYLYVADIGESKIYRYNIGPDGNLSGRHLFANEGSDGMTIDSKGNVYLSNTGVSVYDSSGRKIAHIDVPEKWTGNLCFGGKEKNLLFITASESVYTLQMEVTGVE